MSKELLLGAFEDIPEVQIHWRSQSRNNAHTHYHYRLYKIDKGLLVVECVVNRGATVDGRPPSWVYGWREGPFLISLAAVEEITIWQDKEKEKK